MCSCCKIPKLCNVNLLLIQMVSFVQCTWISGSTCIDLSSAGSLNHCLQTIPRCWIPQVFSHCITCCELPSFPKKQLNQTTVIKIECNIQMVNFPLVWHCEKGRLFASKKGPKNRTKSRPLKSQTKRKITAFGHQCRPTTTCHGKQCTANTSEMDTMKLVPHVSCMSVAKLRTEQFNKQAKNICK